MTNKPEHKFFEKHLNNNTSELYSYLLKKQEDLKNGIVPGFEKEKFSQAPEEYFKYYNPQRIDTFYNIFQFYNESIYNLYEALKDLTIEASEYYGLDFKKEKFMIHGWFNSESNKKEVNLENDTSYHDHSEGKGVPYFHGYYCVNAEPSTTYYKINNDKQFENINKNNRAILSETGHPHQIGLWNSLDKRITIAYDVTPLRFISTGGYPEQSWIPLI
jgi:hypothetical protein